MSRSGGIVISLVIFTCLEGPMIGLAYVWWHTALHETAVDMGVIAWSMVSISTLVAVVIFPFMAWAMIKSSLDGIER